MTAKRLDYTAVEGALLAAERALAGPMRIGEGRAALEDLTRACRELIDEHNAQFPHGNRAAVRRHQYHKEPLCQPCEEFQARVSTRTPRDPATLQPHGTIAAYKRHRRKKEDPCDACREARNAYMAAHREKNREAYRGYGKAFRDRVKYGRPGGPHLAPCGTRGAYERHVRNKEPVDDACRLAARAARAARSKRRNTQEDAP